MNTRHFKVKGEISCLFTPESLTIVEQLANIEVQLWQHTPGQIILLGKNLTDSTGEFIIEFSEESPTPDIVDGKLHNVFLKAFYNGQELSLISQDDLLTGIVAYWKFDETSGTIATDASGNQHNGTLAGSTAPTWTAGKINNGIEINGNPDGSGDSFVDVVSSPDFDFGKGDFSISVWIKTNNTSSYFTIFDSGYPMRQSFLLEVHLPNTINFYNGHEVVYSRTYPIATSTWYHLVLRRVGNTIEIFVNNTSLESGPFHGDVSCPGPSLFLGKYREGEVLDGVLDEIGIWKGRGLSNHQISLLYNSGSGLQYPF